MINLQAVGISRNGQDTQNGEARGLEAPEPASTKAHTRAYMGRRDRCEALLKTEGTSVYEAIVCAESINK